MNGAPRLLVWNYTDEEKALLDRILTEVEAPPAVTIAKDQGHLLVKDIVHTDKRADEEFECNEKIVLFYNIPHKGMSFLIDLAKKRHLPYPIYAAVTEYSIEWPFSELAEHLIEEREEFRKRVAETQENS
jgi:hypothetical protein